MTDATTTKARDLLEEAREAYEAFQSALRELGREVRPLDPTMFARVDAYPGWDGNRDVGMGKSMGEWLDDIEACLDWSE